MKNSRFNILIKKKKWIFLLMSRFQQTSPIYIYMNINIYMYSILNMDWENFLSFVYSIEQNPCIRSPRISISFLRIEISMKKFFIKIGSRDLILIYWEINFSDLKRNAWYCFWEFLEEIKLPCSGATILWSKKKN